MKIRLELGESLPEFEQVGTLWFGADGGHAFGHFANCGTHWRFERYRGGAQDWPRMGDLGLTWGSPHVIFLTRSLYHFLGIPTKIPHFPLVAGQGELSRVGLHDLIFGDSNKQKGSSTQNVCQSIYIHQ